MKSRIKYIAVVAAIIITFAVLNYFAPKQISVPYGEDIYVTYVEPTLEVVDMDSVADMETVQYKLSAGDEGYDELMEALEGVTYRNCLKTLTGSTSLSGIGYVVYIRIGDECYGFYDRGYVAVFGNTKIYRISESDVERIKGAGRT